MASGRSKYSVISRGSATGSRRTAPREPVTAYLKSASQSHRAAFRFPGGQPHRQGVGGREVVVLDPSAKQGRPIHEIYGPLERSFATIASPSSRPHALDLTGQFTHTKGGMVVQETPDHARGAPTLLGSIRDEKAVSPPKRAETQRVSGRVASHEPDEPPMKFECESGEREQLHPPIQIPHSHRRDRPPPRDSALQRIPSTILPPR